LNTKAISRLSQATAFLFYTFAEDFVEGF
jgi:hypothetical protein